MRVPWCRVISLGELTLWGRQFLSALQAENIIEISHEDSPQKFLGVHVPVEAQVLLIENGPESRQWIIRLRQSGQRLFLIWFGRSFSKEDFAFALNHRVYCVFESLKADDKRVFEKLQKVASALDAAKEFQTLLRSLKAIIRQTEGDIAAPFLSEIKTALTKLERCGARNELNGVYSDIDESIGAPAVVNKSESFRDVLTTMHDLERTGVLWVKGGIRGEEGRVDFLQGKIILASHGEVRGLKAIYRMFLWDSPNFLFTRRNSEECVLEDQINISIKYLCMEGEELRRQFEKCRRDIPPSDIFLELEPSALHVGTSLTPQEFLILATIVECGQVSEVLNYNELPDSIIYESLIKLRKSNVIRIAA